MDASASLREPGTHPIDLVATRTILRNAGERSPAPALWRLYAPSLAAYDLREGVAGGVREAFRAIGREIRDVSSDVVHSRAARVAAPADVLFLAMEGRQIDGVAPLAAAMLRAGTSCAMLTSARRPARSPDLGIPMLTAEGVSGLSGLWRGIVRGVSTLRSVAAHAGSSAEERWILARLASRAFEGCRLNSRAADVLEAVRPRLVIGCDDCDPRARSVIFEARERGIPTLVVQYGMAGPYHVEWGYLAADRVAIMGDEQAAILRGLGVPSGRAVVTGAPRFDAAARLRAAVPSDEVLFASQPDAAACFGGETRRQGLLSEVYEALAASGKKVVIRPHPDEDVAVHVQLCRRHRLAVRIADPRHESALDSLKRCATLVTFHSTLSIEAALAGRDVIFYRPISGHASPAAAEFVDAAGRAGWARIASGVDGLRGALAGGGATPHRENAIDTVALNSDAGATERVIRLADSLRRSR